MNTRAYYADRIETFLDRTPTDVLGTIAERNSFASEPTQRDAWREQIRILQDVFQPYRGRGRVYFEYTIPRLGGRIDVLALIDHVVFVIEFKVGEVEFTAAATDQVWDYALDLKNFHDQSHDKTIAPILVATRATCETLVVSATIHDDGLLSPIHASADGLGQALERVLAFADGAHIDAEAWERGRYCPTPTIIEAAKALYGHHTVADISRNDASAINLTRTSDAISEVIRSSRAMSQKPICFVTGVPGAGKTLVGLNVATKHSDPKSELHSVFLSGNGPLVLVLREALVLDKVRRETQSGKRLTKGAARSEVQSFIQNVHQFRDECLRDSGPPHEHVALFDEAQRAWNREQTELFMLRKRGQASFTQSEPEFLISCMDRHADWAVVVCLVGGGQEIHTGEAGIGEWVQSVLRSFPSWHVHISSRLHDAEYGAGTVIRSLERRPNVHLHDDLHLGVSMRSFRAEDVSALVKNVPDRKETEARKLLGEVMGRYPIVLTRQLKEAKAWLKSHARGSERYGIVVSSRAQRLKPHAIDVRAPMNPIHWFLHDKQDVRSSYYLEDVATEFHVQGLELDWACVVWDADFRFERGGWQHHSFAGSRWNRIRKMERQNYLKNAYRVLLTRARQGMVIVVPQGDIEDPTRSVAFYDGTFEYLRRIGIPVL